MYEILDAAFLFKYHFKAFVKFHEGFSALFPAKFNVLLDTGDDVFLRRYQRLNQSGKELKYSYQAQAILIKPESVNQMLYNLFLGLANESLRYCHTYLQIFIDCTLTLLSHFEQIRLYCISLLLVDKMDKLV